MSQIILSSSTSTRKTKTTSMPSTTYAKSAMSPSISLQLISILITFILLLQRVQDTNALECYHCNSEYDPRCGDPFDSYSLGKVNCSMQESLEHLQELKPLLCRKTTQKVYGKQRVVRGCGYIRGEKDDAECQRRAGTHDVQALYCACTTDLCNAAPSSLHHRRSNLRSFSLQSFVTDALTSLPIAITLLSILMTSMMMMATPQLTTNNQITNSVMGNLL